ncbi:hypothetical protein GTR04_1712 [Trichophyton interdigitale]|nr:hypothetical protein GY631_2344 [Trichophyton interdigitale]KAG5218804.1 hypothetical protein GY632_5187 [Trichophyton interdigitale]KAG8210917.1 hypothetical protein GTR04_1712 [Trichophyton interdigitale]
MAEDTVAEGAAEASALQPQPYQAAKTKRGKGKDKEKKDKDDSTPPVKRRNRNTTLQTLVQAILTYDEEDVPDLVRQIRAAEDLEVVAESILKRERQLGSAASDNKTTSTGAESPFSDIPQFESELTGKISELRLDGAVKYVGGTSNLIFLPELSEDDELYSESESPEGKPDLEDGISSWTTVTENKELIRHLLTMYFTWHYAYFTTLSKELFYRDFIAGRPSQYCSALLVNAMLALGCHFSAWPASREDPNDSSTAGDHFFKEAKRLILENDEHTKAKLCTVQALALMRDIAHGLKHLEEIAESWLCARRTLRILDLLSKRWKVELPEEALSVIERSRARFGSTSSWEQMQSPSSSGASPKLHDRVQAPEQPTHPPTHEPAKSSTASAVMNTQATPHTSTYSAPVQISQEDVTQHQSSSTEQLPAEHEMPSKSNGSSGKQKLSTVPQPRMNTTPSLGNDIPMGLPQSPTFIDSDKLLQASQNWWLKDQNALALGMDNWSSSWGTPNEGTGNTMDYPTSGSNSIPPTEATDAYTTHAQQPMHIEGFLPTAAALGLSHPSAGNYNTEFLASQSSPNHPNIANYMPQRGDGEYSEQGDMFY